MRECKMDTLFCWLAVFVMFILPPSIVGAAAALIRAYIFNR